MTTSKKPSLTENGKTGKTNEMTNEKKQLVYVGPSLSKGRLSHGTVFLNGFTPPVQELVDKHPWLKQLMVPPDEIEKAKASMKQKGSLLNILCEKTKEV